MIRRLLVSSALFAAILCPLNLMAQEKKLEKFRTGGGSASAAQMSVWLAKEGNYYEKNGLSVEVISIPGSSLAIQAMLSGELPIIQAGGAGPIQAAPLCLSDLLSLSLLLDHPIQRQLVVSVPFYPRVAGCQPTEFMQKRERMKISYFPEEESNQA